MAQKPNVFIRGIYSTALTKLFIDAGYPIIFPTKINQDRFNIPYRPGKSYSKDIAIRDRHDRQGVTIMFKKHIWKELAQNNFEDFPLSHVFNPNYIIYTARFNKNSVYRGLIVKSNRKYNYSYIRLVPEPVNDIGWQEKDDFRTTIGRYPRFIPDSKEGIFQITHEDSGKTPAHLGSFYTIPGDLVVIVPYNNKVIISKEITNPRQKKRLFDLGKDIQRRKKYGFIFRTAAEIATRDEIIGEVEELEKHLIDTQNVITQFPDRIGEVYSNFRSQNVIFPAQVKKELDQIRREVIPTIDYHHIFKSVKDTPYIESDVDKRRSDWRKTAITYCPGDKLVDFTEKLLTGFNIETTEKISQNFIPAYFDAFLQGGDRLEITHQKLTGKTMKLVPGFIQKVEREDGIPDKIILKRYMKEGGLYDGLNTPIEQGDYSISEFKEASWVYVSSYFSRSGELKGRYFNINTPIEITRDGIHYIDLEIDVVENMMGEREIIDQDLLDRALEYQIITEELHEKALVIANKILNNEI